MLEVTGLTKRYGDVLALDGCSLRVPAGHLVGLLGPTQSALRLGSHGTAVKTLQQRLAALHYFDVGTAGAG